MPVCCMYTNTYYSMRMPQHCFRWQALGCMCMGENAETWEGSRAGGWGLLIGRSWTMLRLGPRQVKVR